MNNSDAYNRMSFISNNSINKFCPIIHISTIQQLVLLHFQFSYTIQYPMTNDNSHTHTHNIHTTEIVIETNGNSHTKDKR